MSIVKLNKVKKILIISSCVNLYKGGQPFTVLNLAIGLVRNGAKVFLITSIPKQSRAYSELRYNGINIIYVPMNGGFLSTLRFALQSLLKSYKLIKKENIPICQVHAPSSGLIGIILKFLTGIKLSLFIHGFWRSEKHKVMNYQFNVIAKIADRLLILLEYLVYSHSNFLIVVNENLGKYLEKFNKKSFKLSRCAITHRFLSNQVLNETDDVIEKCSRDYNIMFVGAFDGLRGQEFLLEVAPDIIKVFPSIKIIFIGDGPEIGNCKEIARKLDIVQNIEFLGHRCNVVDILKNASLCIGNLSPNLDGIGNSHLEAVDAKVPLIVKDDPLIKKVFGATVTYVDPGDKYGFVKHCCFLLENQKYANDKAEQAYKIMKSTSWETEAMKLLNLYQT